jgi:hypothetical protein
MEARWVSSKPKEALGCICHPYMCRQGVFNKQEGYVFARMGCVSRLRVMNMDCVYWLGFWYGSLKRLYVSLVAL